MRKNIIFLTVLSCFYFSAFADQTVDNRSLIGGIMLTKGSKLSEQEKKDQARKIKSFKQTMHNVGITPTKVGVQVAADVSCYSMSLIKEKIDFAHSLLNKINAAKDHHQLAEYRKQLDDYMSWRNIRSGFSDYGPKVPRVAIRGVLGEFVPNLLPEMVSDNVYKKIVCKHIIHCLVDATACPEDQALSNYLYSVLPEQALRGATIETTSWALTEYIFDSMERTGYDPFKIPPYQLGKSELLQIVNPILKDLSKTVVNAVLTSYVVAPTYDHIAGYPAREAKLCVLSLNFGDM